MTAPLPAPHNTTGPLACQFFPLENPPPKVRVHPAVNVTITTQCFRCVHCGFQTPYTASIAEKIIRTCDNQDRDRDPELPSLARRTVNYMVAYASHVAAGRPLATQETILSRLRHCLCCPLYNGKFQACSLCGCPVNEHPPDIMNNKLGWGDSVCPKNPPAWESVA